MGQLQRPWALMALRTLQNLQHRSTSLNIAQHRPQLRGSTKRLDSSLRCTVGFVFLYQTFGWLRLSNCSHATRHCIYSSLFTMASSNFSAMELDIRCWGILHTYATTDLTVGEVESQLSDVFENSVHSYDEAQWGSRIGRIMSTEPDDIDSIQQNIKWIDDAMSDLSMHLYTSLGSAPEAPSVLECSSITPILPTPIPPTLIPPPPTSPVKVKTSLKDYVARKRIQCSTPAETWVTDSGSVNQSTQLPPSIAASP